MLDDIINAAAIPVYLVGIAILLFAAYRSFTIGRVLMKGSYRDRAFWTGGAAIALILFSIGTTLPSSSPLVDLSFFVIAIVLLAFVDSSIGVAQQTDFFHRSPLGWGRLRKPLYILFLVFSAITAFFYVSQGPNGPLFLVGEVVWFLLIPVELSYSAACLVVGARRTPERSMRRFVKMLGLTIVCMVVFFSVWIPFSSYSVTVQDLGNLISELFIPAAAYFLYLAVMSLSPVGRVEKEAGAATSRPGEGGIVVPRPS